MSMNKCSSCLGEVDKAAKKCKHCGENLAAQTSDYKTGTFLMALGLVGMVIGVAIGFGSLAVVGGFFLMGLGALLRLSANK